MIVQLFCNLFARVLEKADLPDLLPAPGQDEPGQSGCQALYVFVVHETV